LPELPWEKRRRYKKEFGITDEDIEMYVQNEKFGNLFEDISKALLPDKKLVTLASNYIASDLRSLIGNDVDTFVDKADSFAKLMRMISGGDISSRGAKDILGVLVSGGGEPDQIAKEMNLLQKSDEGELQKIVEQIITDNPQAVSDFKAGKEQLLQFLIGQGMKETKGAANPAVLKRLFLSNLK